jgi:predicted phosphodiesterase
MHVADVRCTVKQGHAINVFAVGDLHADSRLFREDRLKRWVNHIAGYGEGAVAVCVGDYLNGQTPGHKHFDPDAMRPDYLMNLESYVKHGLAHCQRLLEPLGRAGVPVVMVEGNHDRMMGAVGFTAILADRIGAQFIGAGGFIRVRSMSSATRQNKDATTGDRTTVIYAHHGNKGGGTPGPKVNAMHALMSWADADIYIAGHVHDGLTRVVPRYSCTRKFDSLEIVERDVGLYRAPSFLSRSVTGVSTYADRKEYGTNDEGLLWMEADPLRHSIQRHELPKWDDTDERPKRRRVA